MAKVTLIPLTPDDREQFIRDNQEAFNYGALEEFGLRDDHFEEDREIISRETIDQSIDDGEAYRIMQDGQPVGGVVIRVNGKHGDLDLLFVSPRVHSKGIGYMDAETQHTEMQNAYKSLFEDKAKYNAIMRAVGTIVYRDMRRGNAQP
jgi:hypothetical protein